MGRSVASRDFRELIIVCERISFVFINSGYLLPQFVKTSLDSELFLCGFCDAIVRGYAALAYMCVVRLNKKTSVHLLGGITKLAPLRDMTIPRLKICAFG